MRVSWYWIASLAWVAWSLPSFNCCCCSNVDMLLSCSLICSSTVTLGASGGRGGATTSATLHTKCFSPFLAHVGVSDAAAEPSPETACRVRLSMPLGGGGVSSAGAFMAEGRLGVGKRCQASQHSGWQGAGAHGDETEVISA